MDRKERKQTEVIIAVESLLIVVLLLISAYFIYSCRKAKQKFSELTRKNTTLQKELSDSSKRSVILRATIKTLVENNAELKSANRVLENRLKNTQEKLDAIKKFITDMKKT